MAKDKIEKRGGYQPKGERKPFSEGYQPKNSPDNEIKPPPPPKKKKKD